MPDRFEDIFRNKLDNHEAEPAPGDWNRLQAELARLARQRGQNIYRYSGAFLVLMGLAALILTVLYSPYLEDGIRQQTARRNVKKQIVQDEIAGQKSRQINHRGHAFIALQQADDAQALKKTKDSPPRQIAENPALSGSKDETVTGDNSVRVNPAEAEMLRGILLRYLESSFDRSDAAVMDQLYERFLARGDKSEILDMLRSRPIIPHGFYLGVSGSVNNTWILYQNTYNDFYGSELAYVPDFGYAWGFTAGYNFSDRIGLQAEWLVRARQGQQYEDVIRTRPVRRSIDLTYTQFPVIVKYKFSKLGRAGKTPVSQNLLLGTYLGLLRSATIVTNNDPVKANDRFRKEDIGLVMGVEYDIYLSSRAALSIGSRCKLGMKEINASSWLPNKQDANKSINLAVGIQARLQMIFPKKAVPAGREPRPFN